jgi:hypothetical protein
MAGLLDTVIQFFEQDAWSFSQPVEEPILQTGFQGDNASWTCYAEVREEYGQFAFFSVCPVNAPEGKRTAMAEFLTRANYGLVIGNFEMDLDDGEIRYKTSLDVRDDDLSVSLVRNAVYMNVLMMDRYLPGIMAVLYGDVSPSEAIVQVEREGVASP